MRAARTRNRTARRISASFLVAVLVAGASTAGAATGDPQPEPPTTGSPTTTAPPTSTPDGDPGATSTIPGGVTTTTEPRPKVTSGPGGFGAPKVDPDAPPEPPIPDPSPEVRVLLAELSVQAQQQRVAVQQAKLTRIEGLEQQAGGRVSQAQAAVGRAEAQVRTAQRHLRQDAVAAYISPGQTGFELLVDSNNDEGRTRGVLLHTTVGQHVQDKEAALALVASRKKTLAKRIDELHGAQAVTARQRQALDVTNTELGVRQTELGNARGLSPDWSLPIEGTSAFTAPELAVWFAQHGVASRARTDVTSLAADYIAEGGAQHIRGDMAFAESVLETGSFTNDDTIRLNNFAGIGHCDSCATGFAFGTPDLGVRAQIQLLASYSDREVKMVHPLVDGRLHGPSGCCQTWRELTHTWATNGNYGAKIMGVYREMLYWLVVQRGLAPLVGP